MMTIHSFQRSQKKIKFDFELPVGARLYQDTKRRIENLNSLQNSRAEELAHQHLRIGLQMSPSQIQDKIDFLQGDSKSRIRRRDELRKSVDKETLAFKPHINRNYFVSSTFDERNNKMLMSKYNALILSQEGNTSADEKYTCLDEKKTKEIIKSVTERLYNCEEVKEKKNRVDLLSMKFDYDADLRKKTHQLDRDLRISKVSTARSNSVNHNKSNSTSRIKKNKISSLQSYVPTSEAENLETIASEETEDRIMRSSVYKRIKIKDKFTSTNSVNTYIKEA